MEITERPITLVSLTERAAAKVKDLMTEEPAGEAEVLRVAVQGGFAINNPNATAACGCGHSFQVEDEAAGEAYGGGCGSGCSH